MTGPERAARPLNRSCRLSPRSSLLQILCALRLCYSLFVTRVVIDTDGGVDDALALLLALRSPELQIAAITTVHGNVPVDQATKNVLLVLDRFGSGKR